ncbi:MAG: tRNA (adenosine(37)-N6)-dimethylallyltransferase MiaA [Leptospiraceae bacterium]|nr:tRNA (adenosine(37)-N6)-dimethylallyltransferase MiaA [Leptospiraceae bacterium]MDW7975958.1 tRNA (adenosine(37)-N6)-dimethylallyltransferase MiaA [Leptospiraceae bacterium]
MNRKIYVFLGPTGVGKTDLIFKFLNNKETKFEVISVDSRQVYQSLSIGTAAPSKEVLAKIPHHLVQILSPRKTFSAGEFVKKAHELIPQIWMRNRIPLLCGGTGFYFKALRTGMFLLDEDEEKKIEIRKYLSNYTPEEKRNLLQKIDPESFVSNSEIPREGKIHQNDDYRIQRSLELYFLTGMTLQQHYQKRKSQSHQNQWKFEGIIYFPDTSEWHQRLKQRAEKMVNEGFIKEALELFENFPEAPAINTPGYKEAYELYKKYSHEINEERFYPIIQELIYHAHKRYGKKQITWFRKENTLKHVNYEQAIEFLKYIELNS